MHEYYRVLAQILRDGGSVLQATALSGPEDAPKVSKAFSHQGEITASGDIPGGWRALFDALPEDGGELPRLERRDGGRLLLERLACRQRLIICGGGHIARPLARLGAMLDFDVTVIDDREEFANAARFPEAKTVLCEPFYSALEKVAYTDSSYFVIITRGHKDDRLCLERIIRERNAYIGMIGSRKKVAVVMEQMERTGYEKGLLERVHAPIGLRIGAQTPAEIAVCIAAQLIQTRSGASDGSIPPEALEALGSGTPLALATILEKRGSAPRGVGAKLLSDGGARFYGSVGGGAGEAAVVAAIPDVLQTGRARVVTCDMTNRDASLAGMVCGGSVTVLIDPAT